MTDRRQGLTSTSWYSLLGTISQALTFQPPPPSPPVLHVIRLTTQTHQSHMNQAPGTRPTTRDIFHMDILDLAPSHSAQRHSTLNKIILFHRERGFFDVDGTGCGYYVCIQIVLNRLNQAMFHTRAAQIKFGVDRPWWIHEIITRECHIQTARTWQPLLYVALCDVSPVLWPTDIDLGVYTAGCTGGHSRFKPCGCMLATLLLYITESLPTCRHTRPMGSICKT